MSPLSTLRVRLASARSDASSNDLREGELQVSFRLISLAAVAASALSAAAIAAPAQAAQGAQAKPAAQAKAPAGQRSATRADIIRSIESRFAGIDSNKDASLSAAELSAAQARTLQQAGAVQQQRIEAEYKKLDTNKDNQLSLAEFKAAAPPIRTTETAAQMMTQLDSNKDGKISAAEFSLSPLANFDRVDANKDGTLSAQEAQALRRR